MDQQLSGWDDTIVALATAPGVSAIGVIRLSGKEALSIMDRLFPAKKLSEQASHTLHVGLLKYNDILLDEVVVSIFKAPRSYTGEDVVEVSSHGSPYILQQVIDACCGCGARLARPGEFTQRAFLHGKLDLAQAEAVADLIASASEASRKAALHTMRGGFSKELRDLREELIKFSALIELELDFSQEDVQFADRQQLVQLIGQAKERVGRLLHSFRLGNVIRNGVSVAIIGQPNAGKSTLLNALLQEDRAIVSEIAGTTRDTIEETLNIDGILFRLIDTAGIRSHTTDRIESIGISKSWEKAAQADIIILLFDVRGSTLSGLRQQWQELKVGQDKALLVGNKADGPADEQWEDKFKELGEPIEFISAKEGRHIEVLKERMVDKVLSGAVQSEGTIITNARHYHALREVERSLTDITAGLDQGVPGDLLALDIRRCLHYLGEITGAITNEDQLDYIFSKFCIGK